MPHWNKMGVLLALAATFAVVQGQVSSSWPHDYPGKPSGHLSPKWQSCTFLEALPSVPCS